MRARKRYKLRGMQSPDDSLQSSYHAGGGYSKSGRGSSITENSLRNDYSGRMKSNKDT